MNEQVKDTLIDQVIHQGYILVKSGFEDEIPGHYDKVLNASDAVLTEAAELYNKASNNPEFEASRLRIADKLDEWWLGEALEYGRAVTLWGYLFREVERDHPIGTTPEVERLRILSADGWFRLEEKVRDIAARLLAIEYLERVTQDQS
jgi:hypothetical protein